MKIEVDEHWAIYASGTVYGPFPDPETAQHWVGRAEGNLFTGSWELVKIVWPSRLS